MHEHVHYGKGKSTKETSTLAYLKGANHIRREEKYSQANGEICQCQIGGQMRRKQDDESDQADGKGAGRGSNQGHCSSAPETVAESNDMRSERNCEYPATTILFWIESKQSR
jgi:hypothetical protein